MTDEERGLISVLQDGKSMYSAMKGLLKTNSRTLAPSAPFEETDPRRHRQYQALLHDRARGVEEPIREANSDAEESASGDDKGSQDVEMSDYDSREDEEV